MTNEGEHYCKKESNDKKAAHRLLESMRYSASCYWCWASAHICFAVCAILCVCINFRKNDLKEKQEKSCSNEENW